MHYTVKTSAYLIIRPLLEAISDFLLGLPVAATNACPFRYVLTHFFRFLTGRNETIYYCENIMLIYAKDHAARKQMPSGNDTVYPLTVRLATYLYFTTV